jgi:hypothetical protein
MVAGARNHLQANRSLEFRLETSTCGFFSCALSSSLKRSARRAWAPFSEASASSSPSPDFARGAGSCAMTASSAGSIVRRPSQQGQVT